MANLFGEANQPYPNAGATGAAGGLHLGSALDFYILTTSVNILTSSTSAGANVATAYANGSATSQASLNNLVEIIALQGQPVLMDGPTVANAGTLAAYTLKFAIEHTGAWDPNTGTQSFGIGGAGPGANSALLTAIFANQIGGTTAPAGKNGNGTGLALNFLANATDYANTSVTVGSLF